MRRLRPLDDLIRDPDFPIRVGRLIGAAEMTAHLAQLKEDAETKAMGEKLAVINDWFFEKS